MIIEIPDKNDFYQAELSMLSLALDSVAALFLDLEYTKFPD